MKLRSVLFGLGALVAASSSALAYNGSLSPAENACLFPSHADRESGLFCPIGGVEEFRSAPTKSMKMWQGDVHHRGSTMDDYGNSY